MSAPKARPYAMTRRAEQVDETRLRITEAAVRLHTSVGPARTSIASVAEEAGVTRLTVYRHFETLDDLFVACTAHWRANHPAPDAMHWRSIPDQTERARTAFGELYDWYRRNADDLYPINRDRAAVPASARQTADERTAFLADAILGGDVPEGSAGRQLVAVSRHLVEFLTWHSLAIRGGLAAGEDAEVAVRILAAVLDPGSGGARGRA